MAKASDILAIARAQIGVEEYPPNSNKVIYNTEYYNRIIGGLAYPWCCVFIWWLFKSAPDLFYGGKKTASCTTLMRHYRDNNQLVSDYKPGDLAFYNWTGNKTVAQHVGIIDTVNADGSIYAIEGNTSETSDDNGGKVMRRLRAKSVIIAVARPKYDPEIITEDKVMIELSVLSKGSKGQEVKSAQMLLNGNGYSCGAVDGDFGAKTYNAVVKFQSANKLTADGVIGQNTWSALIK